MYKEKKKRILFKWNLHGEGGIFWHSTIHHIVKAINRGWEHICSFFHVNIYTTCLPTTTTVLHTLWDKDDEGITSKV